MLKSPIIDRTDETESLFSEANTIEDSQQSLLETASIEQQFNAALQSLIQQKFDQVDRIEDKISAILMRQQGRLQKLTNAKPSIAKNQAYLAAGITKTKYRNWPN
jgi:hypothetical protein